MITTDLNILGVHLDIPKWYLYTPKKGKYSYTFSLFSKSGLIKAYLNRKTRLFDIKKGTILLFSTDKLNENTFNKIKTYDK